MRPLPRVRTTLRTLLATTLVAGATSVALATPAQAANRTTPGDFTGYGFDQCLTPEQWKMDRWMQHSPFAAVGVYISGDSRACRNQPNLTAAWVRNQLAKRWKILPITLGPQASCQPRFPRYGDDETINPSSRNNYAAARAQGLKEAGTAVAAAKALGIAPGSTLWYDLEGFDLGNTACRESALRFLHAWTNRIRRLGYLSGVYSSAASGIKMLDNARMNRPGQFTLPDRLWIADWDQRANTSSIYVSEAGWQPHKRVKQYRGGHNETWGGVTINIDSNYMSLGKGSWLPRLGRACNGTADLDLPAYPALTRKNAPSHGEAVKSLQCQLRQAGHYDGAVSGKYSAATIAAINAFQRKTGTNVSATFTKRQWVMLLSRGWYRVEKRGLAGSDVRRLQRALTAATEHTVPVTGVFDARTEAVTRNWQGKVGASKTGVMTGAAWKRLRNGEYY